MAKRKATTEALERSSATKEPGTTQKAQDDLVTRANSLDIEAFMAHYVDEQWLTYQSAKLEATYTLDMKSAASLSSDELTACFDLIEETSRPDYEGSSSFGWHPRQKRQEMMEADMRFLLLRKAGDASIAGFLSFMITHDSIPLAPVLYIYEIHLAESLRGIGLGPHLMHVVESIANRVGLEKVMLTCFLSNSKAHRFYTRRGYAADECSPQDRRTRRKTIKADYVIMFKALWESV